MPRRPVSFQYFFGPEKPAFGGIANAAATLLKTVDTGNG
jgi:hypothetical protein